MRPVTQDLYYPAPVADAICLSQSLGAAGSLTLDGALVTGGVAYIESAADGYSARRITITSAADDSGLLWHVTGTRWDDVVQSEYFYGGNVAAVTSRLDYKTVTAISGDAATAGNVTAGTSNIASTPWVPWSQYQTDFQVTCYVTNNVAHGTASVEVTVDDVFGNTDIYNPDTGTYDRIPRAYALPTLSDVTTSAFGSITTPVAASRLTVTGPTVTYDADFNITQIQQGK